MNINTSMDCKNVKHTIDYINKKHPSLYLGNFDNSIQLYSNIEKAGKSRKHELGKIILFIPKKVFHLFTKCIKKINSI
jgi:hypothetical protein